MSLRAYLTCLTLAVILPIAVFAVTIGYFLVEEQRETFRRGAEERTLAVVTAMDNELAGSISTLEALATSPDLDKGDLATVRERAQRILATHSGWVNVNVALPSGQQLMNLQVPEGQPLPDIGDLDGSFPRLRQTAKPVVSDLAVGPVLKRWSFAVRVPVIRGDSIKYVLSAGIKADTIGEVIKRQNLPGNWVGVIVDRNGRIVARNVDSESAVGQLASQSLRNGLARAGSGWFHGRTLEGADVYTPYRRSELTGWAFAMGIPSAAVEAIAARAARWHAIGLFGALVIAIGLAHVIGRLIAHPIASLASATESIGRGEDVSIPRTAHVDEIRRLAHTLHGSMEALKEADRQKDEFLAMLSHELRNPLSALTTSAYVLRAATPGDAASVGATGVIERQTEHMSRLVEDLLDMTRVRMGKITLKRETLDAGQLVSDVVETWRAAGRLSGRATVKVHVEPAWVNADRARLEQIFANLLDNALKFTPDNGSIDVSVRQDRKEAVLRVADTGRGVSPESLSAMFEPFMQGEEARGHREGGLGLGLALVRRLTELQGGSVRAESGGPQKGAAFTVRLPSVPPVEARTTAARPQLESVPRRVLLIEDNDDGRQMLGAALELEGYEVSLASDGAAGIAAAAAARYDVALIDIGLPDMSGYEAARRMRSSGDAAPRTLIALSGYGPEHGGERAREAGFDVHLVKPIAPDRLSEIIAEYSPKAPT